MTDTARPPRPPVPGELSTRPPVPPARSRPGGVQRAGVAARWLVLLAGVWTFALIMYATPGADVGTLKTGQAVGAALWVAALVAIGVGMLLGRSRPAPQV